MASVSPYNTKSGKRWRVHYRDPAGRSRSKRGFVCKSDAQTWEAKNAVAVADGDWIAPELGTTTVADLSTTWEKSWAHLKPATKSINESKWRIHVEPV